MAAESRPSRPGHRVTLPFREAKWPYQWIAMCTCNIGIRCNDRASAVAFMRQNDHGWAIDTPVEAQ